MPSKAFLKARDEYESIPVEGAEHIAKKYGYDQVVIIGRRVDTITTDGSESVATYGIDKQNCSAAAKIGDFLKYEVMKWPRPKEGK